MMECLGGASRRLVNLRWRAVAVAAALTLGGCGPTGLGGRGASAPSAPAEPAAVAAPTGDTFGSGPKRVALILPLTQQGGPSTIGQSLRNAAELAVSESGQNAVTVLVKDDQSSPEGARAAAEAAVSEGAEIIIGPLYAGNVREVGRVARAGGRPVIAFSTDTSTASRGVYLLSFLVEGYVDRIVQFASSRGKKSFAALVPESDYGNVALAQFQSAAAAAGVRVQAIERYSRGNVTAAAQRIGSLSGQIDALFIPEQADQMASVSQALVAAGVDPSRVQILGTGLWNDSRVLRLPALQGAWFPAPENGGFNSFASKYRAKFNSDPTRLATLSYDATSLVAALSQLQGGLSEQTLTNSSGFNGADGLFRFRPDGLNDRGMSVLQIRNGATSVVSPAPKSFTTPSGT